MSNRCVKNIKIGDSLLLSIKENYINEYIPQLSNDVVTVVGAYFDAHLLATNVGGIFLGRRNSYIGSLYDRVADRFEYFQLTSLNYYKIHAIYKSKEN